MNNVLNRLVVHKISKNENGNVNHKLLKHHKINKIVRYEGATTNLQSNIEYTNKVKQFDKFTTRHIIFSRTLDPKLKIDQDETQVTRISLLCSKVNIGHMIRKKNKVEIK